MTKQFISSTNYHGHSGSKSSQELASHHRQIALKYQAGKKSVRELTENVHKRADLFH
jgi:hypothetical protein